MNERTTKAVIWRSEETQFGKQLWFWLLTRRSHRLVEKGLLRAPEDFLQTVSRSLGTRKADDGANDGFCLRFWRVHDERTSSRILDLLELITTWVERNYRKFKCISRNQLQPKSQWWNGWTLRSLLFFACFPREAKISLLRVLCWNYKMPLRLFV